MDKNTAINYLKNRIFDIYQSTREPLNKNIYRGHSRSISTDIEDSIALFVSELLPKDYCLILDPSIYINKKNNRPDLLVINNKQEAVAMIEIKANMGWCRNASDVLNDIVNNDNQFKEAQNLLCEISNDDSKEVIYHPGVKLFLISLTDGNCPEKKHQINKQLADSFGVKHYLLFSGWYDDLYNRDIEQFADEMMLL